MTLEIYVVQYVIIDFLRPYFSFPINWLIITLSILGAAYLLHKLCEGIYELFEKLINWSRKKKRAI